MIKKLNAIIIATKSKDGKHTAYYAEARQTSGRFAHQTRTRRTYLDAKVEMNNWCKKNEYFPVWH